MAVHPIVKNDKKASHSALVTACWPFMFFQKGVHALGPSPALTFVAREMVCVTKRHFFYFVTILVAGSSTVCSFLFVKDCHNSTCFVQLTSDYLLNLLVHTVQRSLSLNL